MKKQFKFGHLYLVIVTGLFGIMLSACSLITKSTQKTILFTQQKDLNSNMTIKTGVEECLSISHSQSSRKWINNNVSYQAYDVISLTSSSSELMKRQS